MSATNSTTHYSLPSFLGSDKPAWLVDWNGAMATIDSAIYEAKQAADTASSSAGAVASDLATLSGTVSTQGSTISTLSETLTTAVGNINTINGNINTINSLIGNGTPTTTDQTLIGAINEINANVGDPADASAVTGSDAFEKIAALNSSLSGLTIEKTTLNFPESAGNNTKTITDYANSFVIGAKYTNKTNNKVYQLPLGGHISGDYVAIIDDELVAHLDASDVSAGGGQPITIWIARTN